MRRAQATTIPSRRESQVVDAVHEHWSAMRHWSDDQLQLAFHEVRQQVTNHDSEVLHFAPMILGFAKEAIRRQMGMELFHSQLLAAHSLIHGHVAEMQTGEGKTLSAVPAAVFGAIQGRGVHVAVPTTYLAERDLQTLQPVYEFLGLSTGLLNEQNNSPVAKRKAYDADITYGPGYEFGFDYLRDQAIKKRTHYMRLGQSLFDTFAFPNRGEEVVNRRGYHFAIVDEADNVLIDDASSPLVLSEVDLGDARDADAVLLARQLACQLIPEEHFFESSPMQVQLTPAGRQLIHLESVAIPLDQLIRPWAAYVEAALRAACQFHRDVHYIVDQNEIKIVDATTGRIFEDRSWQSGLHQAIEVKEGVDITNEKLPIARITRQRFYSLYSHVCGMTGTATNCAQELKSVYGVGVKKISLRQPSRRVNLPLRAFVTEEQKWLAIAESTVEIHRQRRPVLIGTRTIAESNRIAGLLQSLGLEFQLLNGRQNSEEAEIISFAGMAGAITIATNLAGRGTDIKLSGEVNLLGGLHVIVTECHDSARVDRQLVGRCARQGDNGSAQTFISADDWLLQFHGQWLAEAIRKLAVDGEVEMDLSPSIRKLQRSVERVAFSKRLEMFEQSTKFDSIWKRAGE